VNDGCTVWRDRKARPFDCLTHKKRVTSSNALEENNAKFEAYDSMSARRTKVVNWKKTQLKSGPAGLDYKIKKEIEVNEGSTVWRDRKAGLAGCIATKMSA
jgi:hypothetical protein